MQVVRNNFYIFTGGPGSGKTTLVEALRARGYSCVEEAGRKIIRQQARINGDATHWRDRKKYRELMLFCSIDGFESVAERVRPVFFDRGIPELTGYRALDEAAVPEHVQRAADLFRYNPMVFVAPPWKEIYRNDEERKQGFEEAIETYHAVNSCYVKSGYTLVEIPKVPVPERADFVLGRIEAAPPMSR